MMFCLGNRMSRAEARVMEEANIYQSSGFFFVLVSVSECSQRFGPT